MERGILVGGMARRTGATRKAIRVYEQAGLMTSKRTPAGDRTYDSADLQRVGFILQARGAGFTVAEIRDIIRIRESGRTPCNHVRAVIEAKLQRIEQTLKDLKATKNQLAAMLKAWRPLQARKASVCPHIEQTAVRKIKEVKR
jgi:DNA-binding transcriptional MerR regulator